MHVSDPPAVLLVSTLETDQSLLHHTLHNLSILHNLFTVRIALLPQEPHSSASAPCRRALQIVQSLALLQPAQPLVLVFLRIALHPQEPSAVLFLGGHSISSFCAAPCPTALFFTISHSCHRMALLSSAGTPSSAAHGWASRSRWRTASPLAPTSCSCPRALSPAASTRWEVWG